MIHLIYVNTITVQHLDNVNGSLSVKYWITSELCVHSIAELPSR